MSTLLRPLRHVLGHSLSGSLAARIADRLWPGRRPAADGEILRLGPSDRFALVLHYAALTPDDRHARFNGRVKLDLLMQRYREIRDDRQVFLGIYEGDRLVAVCEICDEPGTPPRDEIALSVRRAWQGRHYGRRLLHAAFDVARERGRAPYLIVRHDNPRMIALAEAEGGRRHRGVDELEFTFPDA